MPNLSRADTASGEDAGIESSRARWLTILRIVIGIAATALLFTLIDISELPRLSEVHLGYLSMSLALVVGDRFVNAIRWNLLIAARGFNVRLGEVIRIYFVSSFAGLMLPSNFGGEAVKAYGLSRISSRRIDSVSSVVVERVIGMVALCLFCLLGYALADDAVRDNALIQFVAVSAVAAIAAVGLLSMAVGAESVAASVLSLKGRVGRLIGKIWNGLHVYRGDVKVLFLSLCLGLIVQVVRIVLTWLAGLSVGLSLDLSAYVLFVPITSFAAMLPLSIAGIGIVEGAYVYSFSLAGANGATVLAMALIVRVLTIMSVLPGAWLYASRPTRTTGRQR